MKQFLARVLWQIQLVEAGVSARKTHDVVGLDLSDGELLWSLHSNEALEALDWDL